MGTRETRTQEALVAARPRTPYRAGQCVLVAKASVFNSLLESFDHVLVCGYGIRSPDRSVPHVRIGKPTAAEVEVLRMKYDCMSPNLGRASSSMACAARSLSTLAPITKYSACPSWEVPPRLLAYKTESDETATVVVVVAETDVLVLVDPPTVDVDSAEEGDCGCVHPETATTANARIRASATPHGANRGISALASCLPRSPRTPPRINHPHHMPCPAKATAAGRGPRGPKPPLAPGISTGGPSHHRWRRAARRGLRPRPERR